MKLNIKAFGLAGGITWGLLILLLTFWFLIMGYQGSVLAKLGNVYIGYSVTLLGAFIGLVWGFIDGFIIAAFFAWLYNKLIKE